MVLPTLFQAARIVLPSMAEIAGASSALEDMSEAFNVLTNASNQFYNSAIQSNIELQGIVRRSATVLAAQTDYFDAAGNKVDDIGAKYEVLGGKLEQIQRDIELETRNIVGATDETTNAVFDQVISNFGQLRGQSKQFTDELEGITPLVVNLTSALKTFQIPDFQIPQELRALLMGDVNNPDSMLGNRLRDLGLTKEAVEQAKAAGKWYDVLMEKTAAFAEANAIGAQSLTNSFSVIQDTFNQLVRDLGTEPTLGLEKGLAKLVTLIASPEVMQMLQDFAKSFGEPIGEALEESGIKLASFIETFNSGGNIEETGEAIGRTIAEIIKLGTTVGSVFLGVTDIVITTVNAIAAVSNQINQLLSGTPDFKVESDQSTTDTIEKANGLQKALGVISDITTKKVEFDVPNPEAYQDILDKYQKAISNSPLEAVINFVAEKNTVGFILQNWRKDELNEIKDVAKNISSSLITEVNKNLETAEELKLAAPKIAAIDVSNLRGFSSDMSKSLNSEVNRLKGMVDWDSLSKDGKIKVKAALNNISSSSDISSAAQDIARIVSSNVANVDVKEFFAKLDLMKQTYQATITELDRLSADAEAGNYTAEVADELLALTQSALKQKEAIDNLITSSDGQVAAQQRLVNSLRAAGKDTTTAEKQLIDLKNAAIAAQGGMSGALQPPKVGQALNKVLADLTSAAAAFATTLGDTPEKIQSDFEGLMLSIEQASQLGAKSYTELAIIAQNAASSDLLSIEQRSQALKTLTDLLNKEGEAKKALLSLDNELLDLRVQRGELTQGAAEIEKSKNDVAQIEIDLQTKSNQLAANKAVINAGLSKEIERQRASVINQYNSEVQRLAVARSRQQITQESYQRSMQDAALAKEVGLTKADELETAENLGTEEARQLSNEIDSLSVQKQTTLAKQNELVLAEQLTQAEERRLRIKQRLDEAAAEADTKIKVDFAAGNIDEFDKTALNAERALISLVDEQQLIELDLAAKKDAYEKASNTSLEYRTGLLKDIQALELSLIATEGQRAELLLAKNNAQTQALIDRSKLIETNAKNEINASYDLGQAQQKLNQSVKDRLNISQQIKQVTIDTQNALSQIEIAGLDFDLGLIEEAITLQDKLASASAEGQESLQQRLAIISEATGIEKFNQEQVANIIERKAQLQIANNEYIYNQTIAQAKLQLDTANQNLVLLEAEFKMKTAILNATQAQLKAERDALLIRQSANGKLTAEEQSKLNILNTTIKSNDLSLKTINETLQGLGNQKTLNQDIYTATIKKAGAEKDHKNNVDSTNAALAAQAARAKVAFKGNGNVDSELPKTRQQRRAEAKAAKEEAEVAAEEARQDALANKNKKIDTNLNKAGIQTMAGYTEGNKAAFEDSKKIVETTGTLNTWSYNTARMLGNLSSRVSKIYGMAGGLNESQIKFLQNDASFRRSGKEIVWKDGTYEMMSKANADKWRASQRPDKPSTTSLMNTEAKQNLVIKNFATVAADPRVEFKNLGETLSNKILTIVKATAEKDLTTVKGSKMQTSELLNKMRAEELQKEINSEDILIRNFAMSEKLAQVKAELISEQLAPYYLKSEKKIAELKAEVERSTNELKTMSSYAALSYQLAKSANSLQELGAQRQTSKTVQSINQIAEDLIEFYSAEAQNTEIVKLGEQLEALRKDPNSTVGQILAVANQIKSATEETADNTKDAKYEYSNILDAIRQGGFFGGDYREAPGELTKQNNELIYSGTQFAGVSVVKQDKPNVNLDEKISDIKIDYDLQKEIVPESVVINPGSDGTRPAAPPPLPNVTPPLPNNEAISVQPTPPPAPFKPPAIFAGGGGGRKEEPETEVAPKEPAKTGGGMTFTNPVRNGSTSTTNITNNFFPNQNGSVSAFLRSNGL